MAVEQNHNIIDMRATTAETISGLRGRNEGWFIGLGTAIHEALPPRRRPLARVLPTSLLPTITLSKAHEAVEGSHWLRALNVPARCTVVLEYLDRLVSAPVSLALDISKHPARDPRSREWCSFDWPR